MDSPLAVEDLIDGDTLVIEYENNNCLIGSRVWTLEFRGPDPSEVTVRTKGRRVISRCEVFPVTAEQRATTSELLRLMPTFPPCHATSYLGFRVTLTREDERDEAWEYDGIVIPLEAWVYWAGFGKMCEAVPHEYRKMTFMENLGSVLMAVPFAVLAAAMFVVVTVVEVLKRLGRVFRV